MSNAEEKSSNSSTDMLPLLRERNRLQQLSEELFQCCDLDDMLIDKYCKETWDKTSFSSILTIKHKLETGR